MTVYGNYDVIAFKSCIQISDIYSVAKILLSKCIYCDSVYQTK